MMPLVRRRGRGRRIPGRNEVNYELEQRGHRTALARLYLQ